MNTRIKIGSKTQIFTASFAVRNDEVVEIPVPLSTPPDILNLKITFKEENKETKDSSCKWEGDENGNVNISVIGWSNSLGTITSDLGRLGDNRGKTLYFSLFQKFLGKINIAQIFILEE